MVVRVVMLLSNPFEPDPRVYKEAKSLAKAGFCVRILAWDRLGTFSPIDEYPEFIVERIQNKSQYGNRLRAAGTFLIFYWHLLRRLCDLPKVAVIHCHDLDTLPLGFLASRIIGAKLVFDAHEPIYYGYFPKVLRLLIKILERGFARLTDANLVTNKFQVQKFRNFHADRITEIRNCPSRELVDEARQRLLSKNHKLTIGRVGYIKEGTGIGITVHIYSRLLAAYPQLRLLLVGKVHPQFEDSFADIIKECSGEIVVTGMVPYNQIGSYYDQIDISLILYDDLQTHEQITPTKLLESMAFGIPVIANQVGDTSNIIHMYNCGLLVDVQQENEIYEKVKLLIENPSMRRSMGKAGRKAFANSLNWEVMEKRLLEVYETLIPHCAI